MGVEKDFISDFKVGGLASFVELVGLSVGAVLDGISHYLPVSIQLLYSPLQVGGAFASH